MTPINPINIFKWPNLLKNRQLGQDRHRSDLRSSRPHTGVRATLIRATPCRPLKSPPERLSHPPPPIGMSMHQKALLSPVNDLFYNINVISP